METNHAILRDIDEKRATRNIRPYRVRLRVLFCLIGLAFLLLLLRLGDLQIRKAGFYSGEAVKRRLRTSLIDTRRGAILDRKGRHLAQDKPAFDICVLFSSTKDKDTPYVLARYNESSGRYELNRGKWFPSAVRLSGLPESQIEGTANSIIADVEDTKARVLAHYAKVRGRKPPKSFRIPEEVSYHPILSDVEYDTMSWVEVVGDNFPGLKVEAQARRAYPYKDCAAHILGYTAPVRAEEVEMWGNSYAGSPYKRFLLHDTIGRTGIEKEYEPYLRGKRGEIIEEIDARGERQGIVARRPPVPGNDLYLTIDLDLQQAAEAALAKQKGAMVLMNPNNGEILALASWPRFDVNGFRKNYAKLMQDPDHPLINRATQAAVPPGSIFKVVTSTAGLESGKLTPVSTFTCAGATRLGNITFGCWLKAGHGDLCLREAIEKSCDIYFYNAGRKVGGELLREWAMKYGLGDLTGLDATEAKGNVMCTKSAGDVYNMAIGQGTMLTTPLQMARMMAAVANGGKLVRPRLLLKAKDCNGAEVIPPRTPSECIVGSLGLHKSTTDLLKEALRNVFTTGTASRVPESATLARFGTAGKTGTAETAIESENQAWLAGFAPYDKPQVCFAVFAERVPGHGGETCVPLLKPVLEYFFEKRQVAAVDSLP